MIHESRLMHLDSRIKIAEILGNLDGQSFQFQGIGERAINYLEYCLFASSAGRLMWACRGIKYRREFRLCSSSGESIFGDYGRKRAIFFEDRDRRLNGGNSDNGGLANVNWNNAANHWDNKSFRPLEVSR